MGGAQHTAASIHGTWTEQRCNQSEQLLSRPAALHTCLLRREAGLTDRPTD